jgi:hypothetical protein
MDSRELAELVSKLIVERKFQRAEELLLEAQTRADAEGDAQGKQFVLSELIELYCLSEPPLWTKAEALSTEREGLAASAYSKLQTAMILYHEADAFARVVPKLEEAIARGRAEGDDKTLYTSLSLLGQAHLELGRTQKALAVLGELEGMVARRAAFVAGDETSFLEGLGARKLATERVTRLACTLVPVCRDPAFKERLTALAIHG